MKNIQQLKNKLSNYFLYRQIYVKILFFICNYTYGLYDSSCFIKKISITIAAKYYKCITYNNI